MKLRILQNRFSDSHGPYVHFEWTEPSAAYYRRGVRNAYRYARQNGAPKHTARHLTIDLLIIGISADAQRYIGPVRP
jgi:hypothetical protein